MIVTFLRQSGAALRLLLALTLLLGVAYPLAMVGVGSLLGDRADGQPVVTSDGEVVGSRLLSQPFEGDRWFQPRPSAVDHDALGSGASNLGPSNPELLALIDQRRAEVATREGVDPATVPPDAVTASASGLDPDISPAYAALQVPRVARENGMTRAAVERLVAASTSGRSAGFLGEPVVNTTTLNAALAELHGGD